MNARRAATLAVIVSALGYFVDIYDLVLFAVVRKKSLEALGFDPKAVLAHGVLLINMQMIGMLVGGLFWGILGDKRGRLSVLFGSIVLYSLANIANAFVWDVSSYAVARFVAGVGLAGELGAGITLVSESLSKEKRGYGTALVAAVGISGGVVGALVGGKVGWKAAYIIGGCLGLVLLLLRVGVYESGMYARTKSDSSVRRGNFFALFANRTRAKKYISIVLVGVPIWYVVGILVSFSPEIGGALGLKPGPDAGNAVMYCYMGAALGDVVSGVLTQVYKSRKRVLSWFLIGSAFAVSAYFRFGAMSMDIFYGICFLMGFGTGYWAIFMTVAAEQFGTNMRATATTTAPNFVRAAVVPLTISFTWAKEHWGVATSAKWLGMATILIAIFALNGIDETHAKELDYVEP